MLETTSPPPGSPADAITRLFKLELDARALSVRSGISEVTLRQIVATGQVNSYVTAIALEIATDRQRSEEHTSELQSLMRISYAVFCLKKKNLIPYNPNN